ncbi:MAG: hypothetical protein JKY48_09655 [Flavobacteriales bacterium]|nr:hypothetical protein [Flavobacteriales bacterium]
MKKLRFYAVFRILVSSLAFFVICGCEKDAPIGEEPIVVPFSESLPAVSEAIDEFGGAKTDSVALRLVRTDQDEPVYLLFFVEGTVRDQIIAGFIDRGLRIEDGPNRTKIIDAL